MFPILSFTPFVAFGIFNGLNDEGGLLILNEAGCEQVIMAGDVFLL